jgi:putative ATP-binding cassette transporter
MTRLRENAESIAFYDGEQDEKRRLDLAFDQVWRNWFQLMKQTKLLNWFSSFYAQAAIVFPYIVAAPRYFSGAIPLGVYTQIADAFGTVQSALSWAVDAFSGLAEWKASVNRLVIFVDAMEQAQIDATNMTRLSSHDGSDNTLAVSDLDISLPDGRPLLKDVDFTLTPGQHVLVSGPSGSGKTTLFRALAGLWPFGRGKVHLPKQANAMFLPQKPYLPIAPLRDALCFPQAPNAFPITALSEVLNSVNLGHLITQLDATENWSMVLSGGEQQRLAIARAILAKPDWLFLDEATSALDEENEQQIYQLLTQSLPQSSIVSIAHRTSLAKYHDLRLAIDAQQQNVSLTQVQPAT